MMRVVGMLLAAGQSARFGVEDKLREHLNGRALIAHAASALGRLTLEAKIAVICNPELEEHLTGFEQVRVTAGVDQSRSLVAGIERAMRFEPDALLVTLGDMPFVSLSHLRGVIEACAVGRGAASSNGQVAMPPACFHASQFKELLELSGDRGARAIVQHFGADQLVQAPADELMDIDTIAQLQRAQNIKQ